jgi:hypothetical protein
MGSITEVQEAILRERAEEERVYRDLLYFYGVQRAFDKLDPLVSDIDPKNESDLLVYELFQGTDVVALAPLLKANAESWVRYTLLKALLKEDAFEGAMGIWKKSLQWQNPDLLLANTLIQYALNRGRFDEANQLLPISRKLAPRQKEIEGWQTQVSTRTAGETELQLDPLPPEAQVAFFLRTRDASPYLESTLGGVAAQNHPVSDILIVDDGNMTGLEDLGQQYPFRVVPAEAGGIPDDVKATHFAMVPTSAAPAVDFTQQFLLALENGPENVGQITGRVEDFYQDTPGDHWRVVRMTASMPEYRTAGNDAPNCGAALQVRGAQADSDALYIPEAVVCGLRQDTLDSAMTIYWQESLTARQQEGHFANGMTLVRSFDGHLKHAIEFINDDVEGGRTSLIFPDFLVLFHGVSLDAQLAVSQGLFDSGTAAYVQQQVIQSIADLDNRYQRNVIKKVREALKERIVKTTDPPNISPELSQALNAFIQDLNALYNGMNQDLYLAIFG